MAKRKITTRKIKDPTVFLGVVIGIVLLMMSIGIENAIKFFVNISAFVIVFGGTFGATLVNFPITQIGKIFSWMKVIFSTDKVPPQNIIDQVVSIAGTIKAEGRLAAVNEIELLQHHFLKHGFQLVLDKIDAREIKALLQDEVRVIRNRHEQGIVFFETMATYAPGFGLLGTLIGLIMMLSNLEDPKSIGPNMGIALVTTFYGLLLSNLICTPLAGRLEILSNEELLTNEMAAIGLTSIAMGDSPVIVKEKMLTYFSKSERVQYEKREK